jgi:uncharacterized protein YdaT
VPWSPGDADNHIKGLSDGQKRAWAKIANSVLTKSGDEGQAIRVANAKAKEVAKRDQHLYVEVFADAVSKGYPDDRAHKMAWYWINHEHLHKKGYTSYHDKDDKKRKRRKKKKDKVRKIEAVVEFSKIDEDKRQVFGWAIVAKDADGNDVIDLQGDVVTPEDVEKAAYDFVIHSRDGGEMHVRKGVARMIESFVVDPEKLEKMGIVSKGTTTGVPIGWWVGFEVLDDGVWKGVKDGRYTGFSVHGVGKRRVIGKRSDYISKRLQDELGRAVAAGEDELVEALAKVMLARG